MTSLTKFALIRGAILVAAVVFTFGLAFGIVALTQSHKASTTAAYKSYINTHQAQYEILQVLKCRSDIVPGYTACVAVAQSAKGVQCVSVVAKTGTTKAQIYSIESDDTCLFAS